jgi:electron transfer flavoprotein beta subunit
MAIHSFTEMITNDFRPGGETMEIVVCVKRVPMTQEVDLEIDARKKDVRKDALAYVMNEWDNYAIEESILLKEKLGGTVTAVTVGKEEDEEVLRRCLAMGADKALRIDPKDLVLDPHVISGILAAAIKGLKYDLILTGVQADDLNEGAVGVMLAERLSLPHSAVVTKVEPSDHELTVRVELEGGMDEVSRISLPALLAIQTGINVPRYVSIMGIRKAAKKELNVISAQDLGLPEGELLPRTMVEELFPPPETAGAQIIEGDPGTIAEEILKIIKEKGVSY